MLVHIDQSLLILDYGIFKHFRGDSWHSFTPDAVPPTVRYQSYEYSMSEICKFALELSQNPCSPSNPTESTPEEELDYEVKFEQSLEGVGQFTAYNDKSVRILFEDRTLIRLQPDMSVNLITRSGEIMKLSLEKPREFGGYVQAAAEFYAWASQEGSDV